LTLFTRAALAFDAHGKECYCLSTLERRLIQKFMKCDGHSCISSEVAEA